jgi:hypothetical protein
MQEDGLIDGTKLRKVIKEKKPKLLTFVNIPKEPFKLADFTEELFKIIGG